MFRNPFKQRKILLLIVLFLTCIKHSAQSDIQWKMMSLTEESLAFLKNNDYSFCGVATPETSPERNEEKVYYLAALPGDYLHFGNIALSGNEKAIIYKLEIAQDGRLKKLYNASLESNAKKDSQIKLSSFSLKNLVITSENEWKAKYSDITVLSDFIPVYKGMAYSPQSLGDYRLTIYHYDKEKQFIDITSWFTLEGPFIALGDYMVVGIRKNPLSKITPDDVKKQNITFYTDQHLLTRLNIGDNRYNDSLQLVFEDNFDFFDYTKWEKYESSNPSFGFGYGAAPYKANNISIEDGQLVIEAKREYNLMSGKQYLFTTGLVDSKDRFVINSGRVDIRMKVDYCPGSNAGLWINPQFGRWPEGQEIDVVEITKKEYAAGALHYTSHVSFNNTGKPVSDDVIIKPYAGLSNLSDWHLWSCEWDRKTIKYYCDNILYGIIDSNDIEPDIPFDKSAKYLVFSYGLAETDKKRDASYKMTIDWIRVYSAENYHLYESNNEILIDYDMEKPLIMHPNEWRGLYPMLKYYDGNALAKVKLKIIQDDNHILSTGSSNMVLYSHGKGPAVCEISTRKISKRFKVVVE